MRTHREDNSPPVESRASARLPELCSAHLSPLKRSKGTYAFAPEANPLSSSAGGGQLCLDTPPVCLAFTRSRSRDGGVETV